MLEESPLLQFVPMRVAKTLEALRKQIWCNEQALPIAFAGSTPHHRPWQEVVKGPVEPIDLPFYWGKQFDYAWFHLVLPAPVSGRACWLRWFEQGESTVYVDGQPWAGLDVAHYECELPQGTTEVWIEVACMESAIWKFGAPPALTRYGCRVEGASLAERNELAWQVYHDLVVLREWLLLRYKKLAPDDMQTASENSCGWKLPVERVPVDYRRMLRRVDRALDAYHQQGLPAFRAALQQIYADFQSPEGSFEVALSGHAHIDLVWLWPEHSGEFKAVHTFATADRLMAAYPEFQFAYSQPASYEAVQRLEPQLMDRVRSRILTGQWEAHGASYVESDTLMACGEALARSFILGQNGFVELTGKLSPILWLPDVFGYAACLPQIMQQTGVDYFYTTKLTWSSVTKFPYSSFIWRGHDGSEVLAHISHALGYNCLVSADEVAQAAEEYRQSDVHNQTLLVVGYGDGGGGPTAEMCERARRLEKLAGSPRAKWTRLDEFYSGLESVRAELPTYRGELYLQFHRGVMTTHAALKDAFRAAERAMRLLEAAAVAANDAGDFASLWKRVVFAQFHDYIPGSSVQEVYNDVIPELRELAQTAQARATRLLSAPSESANAASPAQPCWFNPLAVPLAYLADGKCYDLPPLTGGSSESFSAASVDSCQVKGDTLLADRVTVRFTDCGRIAAMFVDGEPIDFAEPAGRICAYPDKPNAFEAWDIERTTLALGSVVSLAPAGNGVDADGRAWMAFAGEFGSASKVRVEYSVAPRSPLLSIRVEVDMRDTEYLLRMDFPTEYAGSHARFGAPFGSVLRSQQPGEMRDESMWEVPASRWATVCDDGELFGLCLLSEARYGWSCREGCLGVSLVRSALVTDTGICHAIRRDPPVSAFSDQGNCVTRLAITRFVAGAARAELPATLAETAFSKPLDYVGHSVTTGLIGLQGGESLLATWAKPIDARRWVLRLNETMGRRGRCRLQLQPGFRARHSDLSETAGSELDDSCLDFTPYGLYSVIIERCD